MAFKNVVRDDVCGIFAGSLKNVALLEVELLETCLC